jgi:hypothetical protein
MTHDPVGYFYDYAIYHPECFPEGIDPDGEEVSAIFEWEEDAGASTCDACSAPLVEGDGDEEEDDAW